MLFKFAIKMNIDYVDSDKNTLSSGSVLVGRAASLAEAKSVVNQIKYTSVESHTGYDKTGNVYERKRVACIPFISYNSLLNQSVTEQIKSIEIVEL